MKEDTVKLYTKCSIIIIREVDIMKKTFIIGIAFFMIVISAVIILAKNDIQKDIDKNLNKNVIRFTNEKLDKELAKAKNEIKGIKNKDLQDISIENSLKVYRLNNPDIIKGYNKTNDFNSLISDEYSWIFKVEDTICIYIH